MNNHPCISIVVPCFNCENTLAETIECVLHQTYKNWELCCVDDGSSDNTVDIISSYSNKDSRVKLFIRNYGMKGGSACRNIGIEAATGTYVMFLDSDDLLSGNCLERRLLYALENDCDFLVFPYGTFVHSIEDAQSHPIATNNPEYFFVASMGGWIITSSLFKRSFIQSIGAFDQSFSRLQDVEMHLRSLTSPGVSYKVFNTLSPDCFYRSFECGYSLDKLQRSIPAYSNFFKLVEKLILDNRLPNRQCFVWAVIVLYGNLSMIRYKLWKSGIRESFSFLFKSSIIEQRLNVLCVWVLYYLNRDYKGGVLGAYIQYRMSWLVFVLAQRRLRKITFPV